MKIQSKSLGIIATATASVTVSLSFQSCHSFAFAPISSSSLPLHQKRTQEEGLFSSSSTQRSQSVMLNAHPLYIASMSRTKPNNIDNELSAQNPDPRSSLYQSSSPSSLSPSIMSEMHSILDDGHGHINKELATSIWTWENTNLQHHDDTSGNNNKYSDPFPLASKLKYSTRDGLRLIDAIARKMEQKQPQTQTDTKRYNDLVQEGVITLMKCMVIWDSTTHDDEEQFELFASKEIHKSMKRYFRETSDGVGVLKMNLDLLKKGVEELERANKKSRTTTKNRPSSSSSNQVLVSEPCDQIVKPLREAVLDENPTPDEIALSEMIRHDLGDFLERTLNKEELTVVEMRFGLGQREGLLSLEDIALNLAMSVSDVEEMELMALQKLRTGFSNDYISAYLDCDNTEEVSL